MKTGRFLDEFIVHVFLCVMDVRYSRLVLDFSLRSGHHSTRVYLIMDRINMKIDRFLDEFI